METWEEDSDCLSYRESDCSDLEELEANLYSYVHHERNSYFDDERSAECCVSQLEDQLHNVTCKGNIENTVITSDSITNESPQSFGENKVCEIGRNDEIVESANEVKHTELEGCIPSDSVSSVQLSHETSKNTSVGGLQSRCSSPSVIDLSSSDDLDPLEKRYSECNMGATSTPYKECVVIDDSDEEVKIELERVKIKPKKTKKRVKSVIITDIQLNTHRKNQPMNCGDDHIYPQIHPGDPMESSSDFHTSGQESSLTKSWTPEMVKFYDESWGGEYIDVYELQRSMSDKGWGVDHSDAFRFLPSKFPNRRYFGGNLKAWCTQCNRKGHYMNECKVRNDPPRCHRCGSSAHREYSCSEKLCLTCGKRWPFLVVACKHCRLLSMKKCQVCRQPGHPATCCPDLWRRFHATILPGKIVMPPKVLYKDPRNAYCCNCASRGHHVYQCKQNSYSDYVPISPHISSYLDPDLWWKFNSSCNSPSSNWENYGEAKRYNDAESRDYRERRSVKRPKNSNDTRKAKHMRLSEDFTKHTKNYQSNDGSQHAKDGTNYFEQNPIKFTPKTNQQGLSYTDNSVNQSQDFGGFERLFNPPNSIMMENRINCEGANKSSVRELEGVSGWNKISQSTGDHRDYNSGCTMERIVILSPAQLNRLKSNEGQEILKFVAAQFEGVQVQVSGSPSGVERLTSGSNVEVLRLIGARDSVDGLKVELFQILHNKNKRWDKWKSLMGIKSYKQAKKGKKTKKATVDKGKVVEKKKSKAEKKGTNPSLNAGNAEEAESRKHAHQSVVMYEDSNQQRISQTNNPVVNNVRQGTPDGSMNRLDLRSPNNFPRNDNPAGGVASPRAVPGCSQTKPKVVNSKRKRKQNRAPLKVTVQDKLRTVQGGEKKKQKNRRKKNLKKQIVDSLKINGNGIFDNVHGEVGNYAMGLNREACFAEESKKSKNRSLRKRKGEVKKGNSKKGKYFSGTEPSSGNRSLQIFSA